MIKKLFNWVLKKIKEYKRKKEIKKKIENLKKKDPFIYNH
jgi:hypothetical protein